VGLVDAYVPEDVANVKLVVLSLSQPASDLVVGALETIGLHCGELDDTTSCTRSKETLALPWLAWYLADLPDRIVDSDAFAALEACANMQTTEILSGPEHAFLYQHWDAHLPGVRFLLVEHGRGAAGYADDELAALMQDGTLSELAATYDITTDDEEELRLMVWKAMELRYSTFMLETHLYFREKSSSSMSHLILGHDWDGWHTLRTAAWGPSGKAPGATVAVPPVNMPFPTDARLYTASDANGRPLPAAPSVSIIMPTAGRPLFVKQSLKRILQQDYPNIVEVIIVDDLDDEGEVGGKDGKNDKRVSYLTGPHMDGLPPVKVIGLPKGCSVGEKRQHAVLHASGDIIAHWDDDDIYGPKRISDQVLPLVRDVADLTMFRVIWIYFIADATLSIDRSRQYPGFGTLVYKRRIAEGTSFNDYTVGEDIDFMERAIGKYNCRLLITCQKDPQTFTYVRHTINTWRWKEKKDLINAGFDIVDRDSFMRASEIHFHDYVRNSGELTAMEAREPRKKKRRFLKETPAVKSIMHTPVESPYIFYDDGWDGIGDAPDQHDALERLFDGQVVKEQSAVEVEWTHNLTVEEETEIDILF
jgi:glycosyltransferase involved in cell wall biosynthesis